MRETSKHQLWSKVVLKAAFHGVGVKHLICTEMWCTKSLPLCQGEPVSAAPTEKESCPKFSSKKYLVLKPPPLTTELLGTAVLRGDKVERHHFSADGETGTRVPVLHVYLYLPEEGTVSPGRVRSGSSVWGYPLLSPTAVALMQGGPGRLLWLPNPLRPLKQVFVVGQSKNLQGDCEPEECCPDGMQKWCSDVWLLPL